MAASGHGQGKISLHNTQPVPQPVPGPSGWVKKINLSVSILSGKARTWREINETISCS